MPLLRLSVVQHVSESCKTMPGFQTDFQGDEIGISITTLYRSDSDVTKARAELAKAFSYVTSEIIKRLENKDRAAAHLKFAGLEELS